MRHARKLALGALLALLLAACGVEERQAKQQAAERAAMDEAVTTSRRAAASPSSGLWTEEHLLDRLVRSGVAPRKSVEPATGPDWMKGDPMMLLAGGGEVRVWLFKDSAARRAVTDPLDAATGTPPGVTVPYAAPMRFIVQNNLAAVVTGGTATNQERIALALEAGLPVSSSAADRP